jgi:hypothetical protein
MIAGRLVLHSFKTLGVDFHSFITLGVGIQALENFFVHRTLAAGVRGT